MMVHVRGKTIDNSVDNSPPKLEPAVAMATKSPAPSSTSRISSAAPPGESAVSGLKIKTRLSTGTVVRMKNSPGATQKAKTTPKKRLSSSDEEGPNSPPPKRHKTTRGGQPVECDPFCWICHKSDTSLFCAVCPRAFHPKCVPTVPPDDEDWICSECEEITKAECLETRSKSMLEVGVDQLSQLLKLALTRMKSEGTEPFQCPVDGSVEHYHEYVIHPMDLSTIEKNIRKKVYGCTQAFLADVKWIHHNCVVFNGQKSKLTANARTILKTCRMHMNEIEICADCYNNSCMRGTDNWFCDPCQNPHTLVWAKLKGYPFWPAKVLRCSKSQVEVRFFGQHDRAWLTKNQVHLLSKDLPLGMKGKKNDLEGAMAELEMHVKKLRERFGHYEYAPPRTPFDASETSPDAAASKLAPGKVVKRKKFKSMANLKNAAKTALKSPEKLGEITAPKAGGLRLKITPPKDVSSKRPLRSTADTESPKQEAEKSPRRRSSARSNEALSPTNKSPKRLEMMSHLGLNPVVHMKNIDGALPKLVIRSPEKLSKNVAVNEEENVEAKTSDSEAELVIDETQGASENNVSVGADVEKMQETVTEETVGVKEVAAGTAGVVEVEERMEVNESESRANTVESVPGDGPTEEPEALERAPETAVIADETDAAGETMEGDDTCETFDSPPKLIAECDEGGMIEEVDMENVEEENEGADVGGGKEIETEAEVSEDLEDDAAKKKKVPTATLR